MYQHFNANVIFTQFYHCLRQTVNKMYIVAYFYIVKHFYYFPSFYILLFWFDSWNIVYCAIQYCSNWTKWYLNVLFAPPPAVLLHLVFSIWFLPYKQINWNLNTRSAPVNVDLSCILNFNRFVFQIDVINCNICSFLALTSVFPITSWQLLF